MLIFHAHLQKKCSSRLLICAHIWDEHLTLLWVPVPVLVTGIFKVPVLVAGAGYRHFLKSASAGCTPKAAEVQVTGTFS